MHLETREEEIARKLEEQRKALEAERCIAIVKQMEADAAEKKKALDDAKAEKEKALEEQRAESIRQMLRLGIEPDKIAEVTGMPLEKILEIGKREGAIEG